MFSRRVIAAPQRAVLVEHAELLLQLGAALLGLRPEVLAVEQHPPGQRRLQADQVAQQGALAAAAAAHDDEHLAARDAEVQVALDHLLP